MAGLVDTRAADCSVAASATALRLPLIRLAPPDDPAPAAAALARLDSWDWMVPVSPAALRAAFALRPGPWPLRCRIALLGQGSRDQLELLLRQRGQRIADCTLVQAPPQQQDSEGLWRVWQPLQHWPGVRVVLLRGTHGREWLAEQLRAAGASVDAIALYQRLPPEADPTTLDALRQLLAQPRIWQLGAVEAVTNLAALLAAAGLAPAQALHPHTARCAHSRVADAARQLGFGSVETGH